MTEPYVSPDGYHRHRCHHCGYIWEHEDGPNGWGLKREHRCPGCDREEWTRYTGEAAPEQTTRAGTV